MSTETRTGCSLKWRREGETRLPGIKAEPAGERITHPHPEPYSPLREAVARFAFVEQRFCSLELELLLLRGADVCDQHLHLIGSHALIGERVHGFLVFAAIGDHIGQIGIGGFLGIV